MIYNACILLSLGSLPVITVCVLFLWIASRALGQFLLFKDQQKYWSKQEKHSAPPEGHNSGYSPHCLGEMQESNWALILISYVGILRPLSRCTWCWPISWKGWLLELGLPRFLLNITQRSQPFRTWIKYHLECSVGNGAANIFWKS